MSRFMSRFMNRFMSSSATRGSLNPHSMPMAINLHGSTAELRNHATASASEDAWMPRGSLGRAVYLLMDSLRAAFRARWLVWTPTEPAKAVGKTIGVLPNLHLDLLDSPLHRDLVRRIEHIEAIALDCAARIKDGDHRSSVVTGDADDRPERKDAGIRSHHAAAVGQHRVTTGGDPIGTGSATSEVGAVRSDLHEPGPADAHRTTVVKSHLRRIGLKRRTIVKPAPSESTRIEDVEQIAVETNSGRCSAGSDRRGGTIGGERGRGSDERGRGSGRGSARRNPRDRALDRRARGPLPSSSADTDECRCHCRCDNRGEMRSPCSLRILGAGCRDHHGVISLEVEVDAAWKVPAPPHHPEKRSADVSVGSRGVHGVRLEVIVTAAPVPTSSST